MTGKKKKAYESRLSRSPNPSTGRFRICAACNDKEALPSPPGTKVVFEEPHSYPKECLTFRRPYSADVPCRVASSSPASHRELSRSQTPLEGCEAENSPTVREANVILKKITALLDNKGSQSFDAGVGTEVRSEARLGSREAALLSEINKMLEKPPRPLRSAQRHLCDSSSEERKTKATIKSETRSEPARLSKYRNSPEPHYRMTQPRGEGVENGNKSTKAVSWMAMGTLENAEASHEIHSDLQSSRSRLDAFAAEASLAKAREEWGGRSRAGSGE